MRENTTTSLANVESALTILPRIRSLVQKGLSRLEENVWNSIQIRLALSILFLALFLSLIGLHGFSFSMWHEVIDASPKEEIWLGVPQPIRGDDWSSVLPALLSQGKQPTPFSVDNSLIGVHQNALIINAAAPVLHPLALTRPGSWGFFIGDDFGLAWLWCIRTLGVFFACQLFLSLISGRQLLMPILVSLLVVASPFMMFWAFNNGDLFFAFFLSLFFGYKVLAAETYRYAIRWAFPLAWSGLYFVQGIYPPFQIPLGYIVLAMAGGWWLELGLHQQSSNRLSAIAGLGIAAFIVGLGVASYYFTAKDALMTLNETVYPGRRSLPGGDLNWLSLFGSLVAQFRAGHLEGMGANVCEAAGFMYLFPVVILTFLLTAPSQFFARPTNVLMLVVTALFLVFCFIGLPLTVAEPLLLSRVPPVRFHAGFGVLNAFWISRLFERRPPRTTSVHWALVALWGAFLGFLGWYYLKDNPDASVYRIALRGAAWVVVGWGIVWRKPISVAAAVALSLYSGYWFNPLSLGGNKFIQENPISQKVRELTASHPSSRWVVFNDLPLSNLLRMLGAPSLGGTLMYPHREMWEVLDPQKTSVQQWNRYANITFMVGSETSFVSPQADQLIITLPPELPSLRALHVDLLVVRNPTLDIPSSTFRLEWSDGSTRIFSRID